jgi:cyclophilin family peptidyl-prolyl cis-trans isomerase
MNPRSLLPKTLALLFVLALTGACRQETLTLENEVLIVRCEDQRTAEPLHDLARTMPSGTRLLPVRLAVAAGRIGDFTLWTLIADRFGQDPAVADSLAVSSLFPGQGFPREAIETRLLSLPYTPEVCRALLGLDTVTALDRVLTKGFYPETVAQNLWRSKTQVQDGTLTAYYRTHPKATIYSLSRLRKQNIVKVTDLQKADPFTRTLGVSICDTPDLLLDDTDWRVRAAALRVSTDVQTVSRLLQDESPLVVAEAFAALGRLGVPLNPDQVAALSPMGAAFYLLNQTGSPSAIAIHARGGMYAHLAAPHLPGESRDQVMGSDLPLGVKLKYLKNQAPQEALDLAQASFMAEKTEEALQFLLENGQRENLTEIIAMAQQNPALKSTLIDYALAQAERPVRDDAWYREKLQKIRTYSGFILHTTQGEIRCRLLPDEAPLTVCNFIELAEKGYFDKTLFHRVVPAFVCQGGDPTGSGSGGPGYAIRCEYNARRYDQAGMVGMALSGKDTGGSQFFLTHLPTPHLDHSYTIFAEMIEGHSVLGRISQTDPLLKLTLF